MTTQNSFNVAIIGTGFGGLGMAINLKKAGEDDFVIIERAASVGGTWRDNHYPGAACDVQSHLYSFSFAPKHDWSRKFAEQPEIEGYLNDCADNYDVRKHIRFNTELQSANFDEASGLWTLQTSNGVVVARSVVMANGPLSQPATPNLPSLENFKGTTFHSAQWNHDHDLNGERVAVIGTGASAIQFVPKVVPQASELYLFQRSGAWVTPKSDRAFFKFEQWLFKNLPIYDRAYRYWIYWLNEVRALGFTSFQFALKAFGLLGKLSINRAIKDADKRRKVTPTWNIGCKRILLSNDYFPALAQEHVDIIDTGIERIEENAIITKDGRRVEVDTIIFGTGFKATNFLSPVTFTGLNGIDLNEAWRNGVTTYKGMNLHGFPNLHLIYGPNTNLSHNSAVFMLECQMQHIKKCVLAMKQNGWKHINVRKEAELAWDEAVQKKLKTSVWASGCSSWYIDATGKIVNMWPGFTFTYKRKTRKPNFNDYDVMSV